MDDGSLRTAARDTRRQGIIDVAQEVFLTEGFAEASMSAIASRVGGSKGTLYNYFASKQDLFAAVIQDECDKKQAALFDTLHTEGEDVRSVLKLVGDRYTELVFSDESVMLTRVVIAESSRFPELGRVLYEAGPRRGRIRLAAYLRGQVEAGRLRAADPVQIATQFLEMCLGGLLRPRLMNVIPVPEARERNIHVDAAVDVILAAYGTPPEGEAPAAQTT